MHVPPGLGLGVCLVGASFVLYQRTMVRTVLGGDPGEFQIAALLLGVPHPPGYPLWVLLAHLFYRGIPVGAALWRIHLTSPVYAALAVGLVYAINRRLGVRPWVAGGAAAGLAIAPAFWGEAIEPRAYALNALQVALLFWLLLGWRAAAAPRQRYWLGGVGLVSGSLFANHATAATLLPGVALFLVVTECQFARATRGNCRAGGRTRLWDYGLLVGGAVLGLLPYLLPVVRFLQGGGPYYWGAPQTWPDFLALVTDRDFRDLVFGVPWAQFGPRVAWGVSVLMDQYGWPGVAIGLLGWGVLARRQPLVAAALALGWGLSFVTAIMYASATSYFYLIPGHLLWALVLAQAGEGAGTWLARRGAALQARPAWVQGVRVGMAALLVLGMGLGAAARYGRMDRSHDTVARDQSEALLRVLPARALVFVRWDLSSTLKYYQLIEGRRRDLVLKAGNPAEWAGQIHDWLQEGRTVYVDDPPPAVRRQFHLTPAGGVDRVDLLP